MNNVNNKDKSNNKITTWQQDLEIMGNQFLYPMKDLTAILGASSLPYINQRFADISIVQYFNNLYGNILNSLDLENTPIVKDISTNIILTGAYYFILLGIIYARPYSLQRKANDCKSLMITDNKKETGNTIIPIRDAISFTNPKLRKLICFSNGVLAKDFFENDNLERLSKKWSRFVIDAEDYKEDKLIINYKRHKSNKMLFWKDAYLLKDDFKIVLGLNDKGEKKILDFNIIPHITISSSSGGGKTTLFKSIFMQSYLKGATIIIADFKGGLDFNKGWESLDEKRCKIITDVDALWDYVCYDLPDIAKDRIALLNRYHCDSIKEYNDKVESGEINDKKLERIIFGLDEAAQVFTKSKNKKQEEKLQTIREKIETISSLYRSVGIHLVISTQVPSSSILTEAVRHNAVLRICGRANKILSQVAIEKDIASTIKANERGRFATNEDKDCFFQGYLFYENKVFSELKQKEKVEIQQITEVKVD